MGQRAKQYGQLKKLYALQRMTKSSSTGSLSDLEDEIYVGEFNENRDTKVLIGEIDEDLEEHPYSPEK